MEEKKMKVISKQKNSKMCIICGMDNPIGVTLSMNVKYRKPVPYNEVLIGKGLVQKETSKFVTIETEIFDKKGNLLANAEVKYIKLAINKIADGINAHDEMCYLIKDDVKHKKD